jgi:hypothetical protein
MQSGRAQPPQQPRSAALISEACKSALSATQPCLNSPRPISNTAMSFARLARDGNGSKRADLWWPGAGGPVADRAGLGQSFETVAYLAIAVGTPITGRPPPMRSGSSRYMPAAG